MENNNNVRDIIYIITGAAGFLGGTVARKLVESGKRVRAFVLPNDKGTKYLPEQIEIIEGDLCDMESLQKLFDIPEEFDFVCLHIASIVTVDPSFNQKIIDVNVGGTKKIIEMCKSPKCRKLIYCSSTGALKELPKGEKIKEQESFNPDDVIGCYSQSKAMATQAVIDAVKNDGLKACVVFPSGILGPVDYAIGETTKTQLQILKGELPAGIDGSFNLCDVRDLADGIISAIEKGRVGESYILANDEVTFRDFVNLLTEEAGIQPIKTFLPIWLSKVMATTMEISSKITGGKPVMTRFSIYNLARNNDYDCSKAKKELGYKTRSYKETIRDEIQWYKDAGLISNNIIPNNSAIPNSNSNAPSGK
ncbi:putative dihydroflavonol 4-reductase [Neocallimastix lanati (nom. inval.)]|nr:putative dihydroflavonol 4-reductase [Neocallimastix sp. JGI-2020a]